MKQIFLIMGILLLAFHTTPAQDTAFRYNASGLEVTKPGQIKVLIEKLGEESKQWGLTENKIRNAVEEKLQNFKITSLPESDFSLPYRLYLELQVLDSVFQIRISFERVVSYRVGKEEYHTFASVFQRNSIGINSKKEGDHPLKILNRFLDDFLDAYRKANQR
ncbi:MAG: hypothetical protein HQM13_16865 [SAR324 cluster bacterium]|nr:hypothetical protein [SAR324 cluster bacterium]